MSTRKVIMNEELKAALTWLNNRWTGPPQVTVRLFRNDLEPTPANVQADFVEANYVNYNPILAAPFIFGPSKVADGHYEMSDSTYLYLAPPSGIGNLIYGAYLLFGGEVVAADRFPEAIPMQVGSAPFSLRLRVSIKSESIF